MTSNTPQPVARPVLARWIWERNLKLPEVGLAIGKHAETVRRYTLAFDHPDRTIPDPETMERIFEYTQGAVAPASFYAPALQGAGAEVAP